MISSQFILFADAGDILWILMILGSFLVWIYNQFNKGAQQEEAAGDEEIQELLRRALQEDAEDEDETEDDWSSLPVAKMEKENVWAEEAEREQSVGVGRHVSQHMDTHEYGDRADEMGQLQRIDSKVDDHVDEVFDHTVGSIFADEESESAAAPTRRVETSAAAGIAVMLADPENLRQAIILQEIIRRPTWD